MILLRISQSNPVVGERGVSLKGIVAKYMHSS